MKSISELILTAPNELEIFTMPDVRVIGIAHQCTFENDGAGLSPHEDYWKEFFAFGSVIEKLPLVIKNSMVCWTGESPQGGNYYTYMPGVICPAGTPIPDGLDYRDLPASYVAKGSYGDEVGDVVGKFMPLGYKTCYTDLGWNAKLFLSEDEIKNHYNSPCRWLTPCEKYSIEDVIVALLDGELQENALKFAAYLNENQLTPIVPAWGKFSYNDYNLGHMWIEDNKWMFEIFDYLHFGDFIDEDEEFTKAVHDHVNICKTPCHDECWRAKDVKIFGKEFKSVCSQHSRAFVNPDGKTIEHIKKLIEYSKKTTPYVQQYHPNNL